MKLWSRIKRFIPGQPAYWELIDLRTSNTINCWESYEMADAVWNLAQREEEEDEELLSQLCIISFDRKGMALEVTHGGNTN